MALLRAHAAALRAACEAGGGAAAGAGRAAAACASGRRTRLLYYNLASGARPRAAAALDWLATAAACGGDAAAALASGFDFGLPALGALARPPRGAGGGRPTDWGAADPARRPSAALVLAFGVDLLGACDGVALVGLLRQRWALFWGGWWRQGGGAERAGSSAPLVPRNRHPRLTPSSPPSMPCQSFFWPAVGSPGLCPRGSGGTGRGRGRSCGSPCRRAARHPQHTIWGRRPDGSGRIDHAG